MATRLRLPFRRRVEAAGRLLDRFGRRWFTVVEAAHAIDPDGVIRSCQAPGSHRDNVRRRLHRMVEKGLLVSMRHRPPHQRRQVVMFQLTTEGQKLVDLYRRHAEAQEDMDDVLELL